MTNEPPVPGSPSRAAAPLTPEHWHDEVGDQALYEELGQVSEADLDLVRRAYFVGTQRAAVPAGETPLANASASTPLSVEEARANLLQWGPTTEWDWLTLAVDVPDGEMSELERTSRESATQLTKDIDDFERAIRAEYTDLLEAVERIRDNPFWTCQCSSRAECESDEPWAADAVWPDPLSHDPRCPVYIAGAAAPGRAEAHG